jgi:lysozyme
MQTSTDGVLFIENNEGLRLVVYNDKGKPCIGYGHDLLPDERFPNGITAAEATTILLNDLRTRFEPPVNRLAPWANQNQFDALVDFCFNLGPARLATMLHHGQALVSSEMPHWCYEEVDGVEVESSELLARRKKEAALFNS